MLRISHYNIFNGGIKRMPNILRVIKEINPDICGILESVNWNSNIKNYKSIFRKNGYDFLYLIKSNTKYDIVIISKIKLKVTTIKNNICHSIGKIELKDLDIYYLHLDPKLEKNRLKEISILFKKINKNKNNLLMGDFNSLSIYDKYNHKKLIKKFQKNKIQKYGVKKLKFEVTKKMKDKNFIDIFYYLNNRFVSSTPTKFNTDINHSEKIRIDYAFIDKKNIKKITACKIYKSKTTEISSDHYPLYLDIKN